MRIGEQCGPYLIRSLLGEGSMGEVYLGLDTQLQRDVAIKVLRPEISAQPGLVERFRNEATLLARLHHSNLCSVHAFFEHEGRHLMVLQYLNGQDLEALLRQGPQPRDAALSVASDVLAGLAEAHSQNIVHRDLKPANLMLMPNGKVVIMDFGIARVRESQRATRTGFMVGTIEYASPEQIKGLEVDARSDLYALGIILFELLMGRLPFDAQSDYEWITAQTQQAIDLTELTQKHGSAVAAVIRKATQKVPDKRYASADDMLQALQEAQAHQPSQRIRVTRPLATSVPLQALVPNGKRWLSLARENPLMSAALAMFLLGIGFFVLSLGVPPAPAAPTEIGAPGLSPTTAANSPAAPTHEPRASANKTEPGTTTDASEDGWSQALSPAPRVTPASAANTRPPSTEPSETRADPVEPSGGGANARDQASGKSGKRYNFSFD